MAVLMKKQDEKFAIRLQLKWGISGAEHWTITFADWRIVLDTAAAHHGNMASNPVLYWRGTDPVWTECVDLPHPFTGARRHAHAATARTDPGRNRKFRGQADYTIESHDGRHSLCHFRPEYERETAAMDHVLSVDRVSTDSCECDGSGEALLTPGTNSYC